MDYKGIRSVLILIAGCMAGCHVPAPELGYEIMADTVYITRLTDRCNYQYLSADPKKAKKQLQEAERQLDRLIIEYDHALTIKRKLASRKSNELQQYK